MLSGVTSAATPVSYSKTNWKGRDGVAWGRTAVRPCVCSQAGVGATEGIHVEVPAGSRLVRAANLRWRERGVHPYKGWACLRWAIVK